MKIIGGEADLKKVELHNYITDSGRSSLRLLLNSFKDKSFLIPNYLCGIILIILDEYDINYSFYNINNDISIDEESIVSQSYDVLYIINYFGQNSNLSTKIDSNKIIIEDNVFSPMFYNYRNYPNWVGFNSFRKISPIPDGSFIKSTFVLSKEKIKTNNKDFSQIKYKAKDMKYHFLNNGSYSEEEYLSLFNIAERKLDEKVDINKISTYSLFRIFEFISGIEKEYLIRKNNYKILNKYLINQSINLVTQYSSFFILSIEKRDELRKFLFSKNIFLPIHWPKINGISNQLYDTCLSIPVDSRYNQDDMLNVCKCINKFYEKD